MNRTKIEWVQNADGTPGYVWNPVIGCKEDCGYCYAAKIWKRFHEKVYPGMKSFNEIWWNEKEFNKPFPRKPSRIFVGSMSDVYWWNRERIGKVIEKIKSEGKQHQFIFLTKHPATYINSGDIVFPENCILGITIDFRLQYAYFPFNKYREKFPNNLKLLSIEPILSDINPADNADFLKSLDWIIVGCQTGAAKEKTFYPHAMTLTNLRKFCEVNGIALFEKNNLMVRYDSGLICKVPNKVEQFPEVKKCY